MKLMAVDIGNSYAKLGLFEEAQRGQGELPLPIQTADFVTLDGPGDNLLEQLPRETLRWRVCSVNRAGQQRLMAVPTRMALGVNQGAFKGASWRSVRPKLLATGPLLESGIGFARFSAADLPRIA